MGKSVTIRLDSFKALNILEKSPKEIGLFFLFEVPLKEKKSFKCFFFQLTFQPLSMSGDKKTTNRSNIRDTDRAEQPIKKQLLITS